MFGIGKRKDARQGSKLPNVPINIGSLSLEANAVVDVTEKYPWKARPVKEIRLGKRVEAFRDIVNSRPQIYIGDEIYGYAGGSGFDSRGYFVLVEKVGQKSSTAPKPATPPQTITQAPTVGMAGPTPQPEPAPKQAEPQGPSVEGSLSRLLAAASPSPVPRTEAEAAKLAKYSQLTLEEYEAMPMSEAAKVPPHIVERLHDQSKKPAPTPQSEVQAKTGLQQDPLKLFAGEQETVARGESPDYSQLTLEEYEAMPMSEAAKVPSEVVERLRRRQQEKEL